MSSKIAVMADPDTVTGFMLGGIKDGFPVKNMEEAGDKLKELAKEYSIIITTEKIGDNFRETIEKMSSESALPMIIEIPDKEGSVERESDPIRELIKRVIGVEMVE
ncbi:MAG: V-type ATP synthase subunit F [Euryarchaeota archaeon]|jgi:V/A-type H+-transporting ATPase subunit F|uniref:V-type ATP synthase subunit F n=1 Tax=Methanobacterium sp. MZD130B TaxID=3394378 RepID=UPI0017772F40|nr:V-type ATP synthase subunit F [Euryarchaeota archaeon]HHT19079.1 V-type ATP synthase subunit F [Methanobacterium sp.]